MFSKSLLSNLIKINQKLKTTDPNSSKKIVIMAKTLKIQEELGELTNEIMAKLKFQRKEKLIISNLQNLEKEWADVLITVLLLGLTLKINPNNSLRKRLKTINKRLDIK